MLVGSIYGGGFLRDEIFNANNPRNRDDCLEPFRVMRDYALRYGIELHTADVVANLGLKSSFGLHIESDASNIGQAFPEYLIRFETPLTAPLNADLSYLNKFKAIFTWDLDLLEGLGVNLAYRALAKNCLVEVRTPNPLPNDLKLGLQPKKYSERHLFCCLIASNRHANLLDRRELYSQRANVIRWFEKNAPQDFRLFGNGWLVPEKRFGSLGWGRYKIEKIFSFITRCPVFPSYQGPVKNKQLVLSESKFCICFENARDIRGYLTEKIFDCLFSGCLPIYWGEPHIERWLPNDCFIDFRNFKSYEQLFNYLKEMTSYEFLRIQKAGQDFINSEKFYPHSSQAFAQIIIDRIVSDTNSEFFSKGA